MDPVSFVSDQRLLFVEAITHFHFGFALLFLLSTTGEYLAYWKEIFRVSKEQRHDFGTLPNKSKFDEKWFEKRSKAANDPSNPFNPFSNTKHYVWAALENIMAYFNTRGCLEPASICVEDYIEDVIDEGDYKGIPYIRLLETYGGQKNKALTNSAYASLFLKLLI